MTEAVRPEGRHGASAVPRFSTEWSRGCAGLYARVSTIGQTADNQLLPLRAFAAARGWTVTELTDQGVSGAKEHRPGLDALLAAARRREIDVIVVTKLDRLARSLHQLVALSRELEALGVDLVVLDQAIDTTTPSGRLLFHMLAAIAEFERDLIRDRVVAGLRRVQSQGTRLGRPRTVFDRPRARRLLEAGQSIRQVARLLGVSRATLARAVSKPPAHPLPANRCRAERE